jgi:hypothetical protein
MFLCYIIIYFLVRNDKSGKREFDMMLNLTQHILTIEQQNENVVEPLDKEYIRSLLTFDEIPSVEKLQEVAIELAEYASAQETDSVMIGGAAYLMPYLIFELNKRGIDAYYSFSKRVSEDFVQDSDVVIKRVIFRHCGFIKATLPND